MQAHPESTPLAGLRVDSYAAAHSLNSLLDDRQANAGAFIGLVRVKPLEAAEDAFLIFRRNPDPIVLKPNLNITVRRNGADPDPWPLARRHEFHSIPEQVGYALAQESGMTADLCQRLLNLDLGVRLLQTRVITD